MTPEGRRGLAMIPEGFDSWVYTGVHTPGDVLVPAAVAPVIGRLTSARRWSDDWHRLLRARVVARMGTEDGLIRRQTR